MRIQLPHIGVTRQRAALRTFYADSVAGSDANDGLSSATAKQTLTALTALAGNGSILALARGSYWRDTLDIGIKRTVTVVPYGTGAAPVIDGADILTGWTKTGGLTNVWQKTLAYPKVANGQYIAWEDGISMLATTSTALVDAVAGKFYVNTAGANPIFYIHASDSADPNSNGKLYEGNVRNYVVSLAGDGINSVGNNVVGVVGTRSVGNDGSIRIGPEGSISRVIGSDGHKHNLSLATGTAEDVIIFGINRNATVNSPFVAYYNLATYPKDHAPLTIRRMFILAEPFPPAVYAGQVGIDNHVSGGLHGTIIVEAMAIRQMVAAGQFSSATTPPAFLGLYLDRTTAVGNANGGRMTVDCCQMVNKSFGGGVWRNVDLDNLVVWQGTNLGPSVGLTINRISLIDVFQTHYGTAGTMACSDALSLHFAVLIVTGINSGVNLATNVANYVGDYNVFSTKGTAEVAIYNRTEGVVGTFYTTLASWQAASGQDAHSCWLTDAQAAAFWLGDPSLGDFRINPSAQVTGANGTIYTGTFPDGTPITQAGAQFHYDWNTRTKTAGPPLEWPVIPSTLAESKTYIDDPAAWDFYP